MVTKFCARSRIRDDACGHAGIAACRFGAGRVVCVAAGWRARGNRWCYDSGCPSLCFFASFFPEGLGDLGVVLGGGRSLSSFAFFEVNLEGGGVFFGRGVFINFADKCGSVQVVGGFLFMDDVVYSFR